MKSEWLFAIMLLKGYTSVSRLINTEPSELLCDLCLRLSEPIASESVAILPGGVSAVKWSSMLKNKNFERPILCGPDLGTINFSINH